MEAPRRDKHTCVCIGLNSVISDEMTKKTLALSGVLVAGNTLTLPIPSIQNVHSLSFGLYSACVLQGVPATHVGSMLVTAYHSQGATNVYTGPVNQDGYGAKATKVSFKTPVELTSDIRLVFEAYDDNGVSRNLNGRITLNVIYEQ